jgi:Winged helix DNA-binding domain
VSRAAPRQLGDREVRLARIRSQRLTGERARDVRSAVRGVLAIQAQEARASRLAVRPRSVGVDAAAVVRACNEERSVVRTWAMRGTLQMLASDDVRWVVDLLRPPAGAVSKRRLELGLDDHKLSRALPLIEEILTAGGPLTRDELVQALAAAGLRIDATSQAPAHLVSYAARQGLTCRGPDREDDEPTYVLLDRWVGEAPALDREAALAELARRFLDGHGPAGVDDLAHWAGISAELARRGVALVSGDFEEVRVAGRPAWMRAEASSDRVEDAPCVRLLPRFDAYLLGYRSRDLTLDSRVAPRIQAGGGIIHPTLVVDGRVAGTWRQVRARAGQRVEVEAFEPLGAAVVAGLEAEVADLARFVGVESELVLR